MANVFTNLRTKFHKNRPGFVEDYKKHFFQDTV